MMFRFHNELISSSGINFGLPFHPINYKIKLILFSFFLLYTNYFQIIDLYAYTIWLASCHDSTISKIHTVA